MSTSDPTAAMETLAADQNAPYRRLSREFRHAGFSLTRLKRAIDVAIYRQSKNEHHPSYEVVLIRKSEARSAFGHEFPAAEYYPRSEDWGTYGFTYRTIEGALAKFAELTGKAKEGKQ